MIKTPARFMLFPLSFLTILWGMQAGAADPNPHPRHLLEIIQREQTKNIKRSTGTAAYNCFTDEDLARFKTAKRPQKVVELLSHDQDFIATVKAVGRMPEKERNALLAEARRLAQPTFAEYGSIDKDGHAQTDAGQAAQLLLSAAIVDAVDAMLRARG